MKSNFLKQEQQFQADIDKLREELATAQANGREAAALMQRLASGQVDMEEEVVELPESSRESLLSAGPPAAEGFLQDDLRAASQVRLGARMPAPPQETAPMMSGLPAEGGPTATTTTVPGPTSLNAAYVTQEPNAETGPYQASPSAHVGRVTTSPRPPRTGTSPKVPREPIKRLLKPEPAHPEGPSLSDTVAPEVGRPPDIPAEDEDPQQPPRVPPDTGRISECRGAITVTG